MKKKLALVAAAGLLASQSTLAALALDPIQYEGELLMGGAALGQVGPSGWTDSDAAEVDFWWFEVATPSLLDIWVTRLDTGLDPAFTLYAGFDDTAPAAGFDSFGDFGLLTYEADADDQVAPPGTTGPFDDPALYSYALGAGAYTIAVGGFASAGTGPFDYAIQIDQVGSAPAPVPLPGALVLLGGALLGLAVRGRRRV
jgi:hypothetical protein